MEFWEFVEQYEVYIGCSSRWPRFNHGRDAWVWRQLNRVELTIKANPFVLERQAVEG
jgi:hypothetical protein